MPAPTDPINTPIDPVDPNIKSINVKELVAEVTGDLVNTANAMAAHQADATATYATYHDATVKADDAYNALLAAQTAEREATALAQEAARTKLFTDGTKAVADAHATYQVADASKKAAEAAFNDEIKYVVGLAGGDPAAVDPTPKAA